METDTCAGECLDEAKALKRFALTQVDSAIGTRKRDVDKRFRILSDLEVGDVHKQAELALEHTLALYEAAFGREHPSVAQAMMVLSQLYNKHGNLQSASYVNQWAQELMDHEYFMKGEDSFFKLFGMDEAVPTLPENGGRA